MKKLFFTSLVAGLTLVSSVQARQIIDRTNNFFINLPDRFLLEPNANTDNKYVVLNAYDPDDEATFIIKISPAQASEISGMALDNERSKFRDSLIKMGLDPYVEGILHIAPSHESIYTFSKLDDQGEILNYLMAKFWAHNKEYSFFCIQPTKTLRTQEFLDSVDSFVCLKHQNYTLPGPQKKERPEYDKAKDKHEALVKEANLKAKKLVEEGKAEEATKLLTELPKFTEKPLEYIPMVEINGLKPLPKNITDKVEHDALFSEQPELVYAKARSIIPKSRAADMKQEYPAAEEINPEENKEQPQTYITPPPITRNNQGVTVIRDGRATQDYEFKPEKNPKLTSEEIKQMEKMKKEQEKFEKEQTKRQEKLDKLRKKELEKERKRLEKEAKKNKDN